MAATAAPGFVRLRNRILIASADASFRKRVMENPAYAESLSEEAVGGAQALAKLLQFPCDSVVIDRFLPDLDAMQVAEQTRRQFPRIEVELVDSQGAQESCDGPFAQSAVGSRVSRAKSEKSVQTRETMAAAGAAGARPTRLEDGGAALPGMIGSSRAMQQVYRLARMVASRDTTVLITGETGTGKELVALAIHKLSRRARHPFVVVNCAAIPEALLEAELFGHPRGAFTGAVQSRLGRVHVAQGGTLFLDEVGELPLSMQAKLLRFLQNGEVQRLGSSDVYRVDVRVVCATNVRLLDLVHETISAGLVLSAGNFPDRGATASRTSGRYCPTGGAFSGKAFDGSRCTEQVLGRNCSAGRPTSAVGRNDERRRRVHQLSASKSGYRARPSIDSHHSRCGVPDRRERSRVAHDGNGCPVRVVGSCDACRTPRLRQRAVHSRSNGAST